MIFFDEEDFEVHFPTSTADHPDAWLPSPPPRLLWTSFGFCIYDSISDRYGGGKEGGTRKPIFLTYPKKLTAHDTSIRKVKSHIKTKVVAEPTILAFLARFLIS